MMLSGWRRQTQAAMEQLLREVWYSSIVRLRDQLWNLLATTRSMHTAKHCRTTSVVWEEVLQEILRHNANSILHPLIKQ